MTAALILSAAFLAQAPRAVAAPPSAIWTTRVAEIQAARRAAGVPPLIVHPAAQSVADRHLAKCLATGGGFQHIGMDGDFLDHQLTRAGLPSSMNGCVDLGSSDSHAAGLTHPLNPDVYSNPRRTHYSELRNPAYRYLGFACARNMSVVVLASGR